MDMVVILGIIGFFLSLFMMQRIENGANGIRKYDAGFRPLDMRLRYHANTVYQTFEELGIDGRNAYGKYLIVDFFFIACFFIVMLAITRRLVHNDIWRKVLIALALFRGVFDVLENMLILSLMQQYPTQNVLLANICSWATTIKFAFMFLWMIGVAGSVLLVRIRL